jgi:hypothetical protein
MPRQHPAGRWVVFHHTVSRLLEVGGITRRGLEQLHEELTLGMWRVDVVPDGFRVQADALRARVERLLQHHAEQQWRP